MKLKIVGFDGEFTANALEIADDVVTLSSGDLVGYIKLLESENDANNVIVDTPAPPAPAEVKYELAKDCPYSIADLEGAGWTTQAMVDAKYLVPVAAEVPAAPVEVPKVPEAPKVPEVPEPEPEVIALAPGEFQEDDTIYQMQAIAAGASYQQFKNAGWTLPMLLKNNYIAVVREVAKAKVPAAPAAPVSTEERTYPWMNGEGDWEDSEGTVYDETQHGMSKDKIPAVTTAGVFKKRRGGPAAPAAPAAPTPPAPESKVPSAPAAPIEGVIEDDEDLDEGLANILKQWN